jgi:hypothetical protein
MGEAGRMKKGRTQNEEEKEEKEERRRKNPRPTWI